MDAAPAPGAAAPAAVPVPTHAAAAPSAAPAAAAPAAAAAPNASDTPASAPDAASGSSVAAAGKGDASTDAAAAAPAAGDAGPSTSEPTAPADIDALLKEFYGDVKDVDRDNEVNRILWAFKLNPFERLNLRFDATDSEVKKQYRKLSLMVHPDKCKHPQASTAFDILGEAQKQLFNEELRNFINMVLETAREDVRKARRKQTKHDSAVRVAAMLSEEGRAGVEAAWEQSDEFHEQWRVKAREYMAQTEWKRRKTVHRLKDELVRDETAAKEAKEAAKKKKEKDKEWEKSRDKRVNTWRDFANKKRGISDEGADGTKAKAKKSVGETKAPKLKTNDEDKLYVQRPVTEQFRPAQPVQMKQGQINQAPPGQNRPRR